MRRCDAVRRALDWLLAEKPDGVSSRLLSHRTGDWHQSGNMLVAPAGEASLRAWLSPSHRALFVRLSEADGSSAELRVSLPAALVGEIAA